MKLSPHKASAPKYPALAAALVGATSLALSSCTCPSCGGSGLQVPTPNGNVPYTVEQAKGNPKTQVCNACKGTGARRLFGQPQIISGDLIGAVHEINPR